MQVGQGQDVNRPADGCTVPPSPATATTPTEAQRQRGFYGGFDSIWSGHAPQGAAGNGLMADGSWSPGIAAGWDSRQPTAHRVSAAASATKQPADRSDSW